MPSTIITRLLGLIGKLQDIPILIQLVLSSITILQYLGQQSAVCYPLCCNGVDGGSGGCQAQSLMTSSAAFAQSCTNPSSFVVQAADLYTACRPQLRDQSAITTAFTVFFVVAVVVFAISIILRITGLFPKQAYALSFVLAMILCFSVLGKLVAIAAASIAGLQFTCPLFSDTLATGDVSFCTDVLLYTGNNNTALNFAPFVQYGYGGSMYCSSGCAVSVPYQVYLLGAVSLVAFFYNLYVLYSYLQGTKLKKIV